MIGRQLAGRTVGQSLSDEGRAQAEAIAAGLRGRNIAAVVSSPLQRARETAAPLARELGLEVEIDEAFNEIDFGDWTGMAFDRLHDLPEWQEFNRLRSLAQIPGGETMLRAQSRAVHALARLRTQHAGGEVVIVSHGDIIKALVAYALGVFIDLFQRIEIECGSRSILAIRSDAIRVLGLNLPRGGS